MGYIGITGYILGLYRGVMEKKMETTIMGYIGIIGFNMKVAVLTSLL